VTDAEAVCVQLWDYQNNNWNATWHQLGSSALPTSDTNAVFWYNITNAPEIQRFVDSSGSYRIRLADEKVAMGTPDSTRSRFYIDDFRVVFRYFFDTVDVTYTFTETNSSASWQSISIKDSSYGDPLTNVSIFNNNSGQWESILTSPFTGGTYPSEHVNVNTGSGGNASSYDAGLGQIMLRYNWTGSSSNNALGVDMINMTVRYSSGGVYRLNITANTTGIPNASTHILQIGYNVSGDNFTVQIWNGSGWNNRITLNKTNPDCINITLQAGELCQDGTISEGSVGDINTYYMLVRYLDINASAVQQGRLYLDYQRVCSGIQ
jgi:hypothetical protein